MLSLEFRYSDDVHTLSFYLAISLSLPLSYSHVYEQECFPSPSSPHSFNLCLYSRFLSLCLSRFRFSVCKYQNEEFPATTKKKSWAAGLWSSRYNWTKFDSFSQRTAAKETGIAMAPASLPLGRSILDWTLLPIRGEGKKGNSEERRGEQQLAKKVESKSRKVSVQ